MIHIRHTDTDHSSLAPWTTPRRSASVAQRGLRRGRLAATLTVSGSMTLESAHASSMICVYVYKICIYNVYI